MTSKFVRYFWIVILVLLAACGEQTGSVMPTSAPTSTLTVTSAPTFMLTAAAVPRLTPILPKPTVARTKIVSPPSPPVSSAPDGLIMAYHFYGGLYLQDGSKPLRQLTQNEMDFEPKFSDDGKKIVFLRGKEIHSINFDGSHEQVLVTNRLLMALDASYNESTEFHSLTTVPGTHLLLFGTQEIQSDISKWNGDLFVVDTDTAEIKRLLPLEKVSNFYVSPDGRFIAIDMIGRIGVIDIEGKIISQNLLTYTPSEPIFLPPGIYWLQDSKGLVVALPVPTVYDTSGGAPNYTVWRHTFDGTQGIQVLLDPRPKGMPKISLDGNWIIYQDEFSALYVGDLQNSNTQLYVSEPSIYLYMWSPDSVHFIYGKFESGGRGLYLGSVDSRSAFFIDKGDFVGWLDANRFLYYVDKTIVMSEIGGKKDVILTNVFEAFLEDTIFSFAFPNSRKDR